MKKVLRTGLGICMLFIASCEDYSDDFTNLNERIDTLESQIAGFSELSSGISALDTKIGGLNTIVNSIPDNAGFSSSVGDIQDKIDMLEEALALLLSDSSEANVSAIQGLSDLLTNASGDNLDALADLGGSLQEQVDALNAVLGLVRGDLRELLNANNVYPGDMIILNEGALEAAIAWVEDRETLIVDGAFVIDGSWADGIMSGNFDIERVNLLTSKIVAILGRDFTTGYIETQDWDGDLYADLDGYDNPLNNDIDGDIDGYVDLYTESVFQEVGTTVWAGELDSMEGNGESPLDFSNLITLRGAFEINEIYAAGIDMSSLQRQIGGTREYVEDEIVDYDAMYPLQDFNGNGLDNKVQVHSFSFEEVEGHIDLSSLISAEDLYFYYTSTVDLSSLVSVHKDLITEMTGVVTASLLKTVGEDLILDYGGGYIFPELKYVGDLMTMVDYGLENEYGAPTTRVDFPKLAYVGDMIEVLDEYYDGDTDNEFSNATYVNILGLFSDDYDIDGTEYGFGAPLATTVIINGDTYYEEDKSIIMADLYVYAPLADVTLTFTETYDDYGDGDLGIVFKTLTAANLDYIDGDLKLYGPEWDEVQPELTVNLPELVTIDGDGDYAYVYVDNVYELLMPKHVGNSDVMYYSYDLRKFTAASIHDNYVDFMVLESFTLNALEEEFNFDNFNDGYEEGVDYDTLTEVNITGKDCSASVLIGINGSYETDYDSLETLTLAGIFSEVQVVGADGLTTINTTGEITSWDFVNNDAVTSYNVAHTPGSCID